MYRTACHLKNGVSYIPKPRHPSVTIRSVICTPLKRRWPIRYQLLPPLTAEEYQTLKDSIAAVGVLQPVVVDGDGFIIDGHHRAQVCDELGIEYPTVTLDDLDEEAKIKQVLALNLGRRHLDAEQKRALVLDLRERGLSIRQIAEATGIPRSTVHRFTVPDGTPTPLPRGLPLDLVEHLDELFRQMPPFFDSSSEHKGQEGYSGLLSSHCKGCDYTWRIGYALSAAKMTKGDGFLAEYATRQAVDAGELEMVVEVAEAYLPRFPDTLTVEERVERGEVLRWMLDLDGQNELGSWAADVDDLAIRMRVHGHGPPVDVLRDLIEEAGAWIAAGNPSMVGSRLEDGRKA